MIKTIYFLSSSNACRGQMAEGFAKKVLPNWDIRSAGVVSTKKLDPLAVKLMTAEGIDISQQTSNTIDQKFLQTATVVVTLSGESRDKSLIPQSSRWLDWSIDDPTLVQGDTQEVLTAYQDVKDNIKQNVSELANYIKDHT